MNLNNVTGMFKTDGAEAKEYTPKTTFVVGTDNDFEFDHAAYRAGIIGDILSSPTSGMKKHFPTLIVFDADARTQWDEDAINRVDTSYLQSIVTICRNKKELLQSGLITL